MDNSNSAFLAGIDRLTMKESSDGGESDSHVSFLVALTSGACAGMAVDVSLFPLDTVKTRLQSPHGFLRSGGFRGMYRGLTVTALGSAPGAALFFSTYEWSKQRLAADLVGVNQPVIHIVASSFGEIMACLVRVPTEVVKQRMQVQTAVGAPHSAGGFSPMVALAGRILTSEGIAGFYTGFAVTVMREIPFSAIQFPIFEALKLRASLYWNYSSSGDEASGSSISSKTPHSPPAWVSAACGSLAGGIAAAVTTPLDVAKTRIMIGKDSAGVKYAGLISTLRRVHAEGGGRISALFAGLQPRVMWISIGGFVFFGTYEFFKNTLTGLY